MMLVPPVDADRTSLGKSPLVMETCACRMVESSTSDTIAEGAKTAALPPSVYAALAGTPLRMGAALTTTNFSVVVSGVDRLLDTVPSSTVQVMVRTVLRSEFVELVLELPNV